MQITNGDNLADIVHLKERLPLIKTWVLVKQMLQSPIKNFGLQNTVKLNKKSTHIIKYFIFYFCFSLFNEDKSSNTR